jgi:HEAT repeat protein
MFGVWVAGTLVAAPVYGFLWPNSAERIEAQLRSSDPVVRRRAAARLAKLPRAARERLVPKALTDSDAEVRLAVTEATAELSLPGLGDRVVGWLSDPDRRIRLAAARLLTQSPGSRAVAALGRVLGDPDPQVRMAAAGALAVATEADAALVLLGHVDDPDHQVRRAVILGLARLADPRSVVPLIGKVQDARPEVRGAAARALGELGDARAVSALVLALRDNDEMVQIAALDALGALKDKTAVTSIVGILNQKSAPPVLAAALRALGGVPAPESLDALVKAVALSSPDMARQAAQAALTKIGQPAVAHLEKCLSGRPARAVADGCVLALGQTRRPDAVPVVSGALQGNLASAEAALEALGALGAPNSLPGVLEYLSDPDPKKRRAAIDAASKILDPQLSDGRAVEPIARALAHAKGGEETSLIALLGRTGSPRATALLVPIAQNANDLKARRSAIEALGWIAPSGQDRVLLEALSSEESLLRMAAALSLARAGAESSTALLLDRLERAAEEDRGAIAIALAGPLSRTKDPGIALRLERMVRSSSGGQRDALIAALGWIPGPTASQRLAALGAHAADPVERMKVAEALASHPEATATLSGFARDVDSRVRANAVWALGSVGSERELPIVVGALSDRDVAVAGNAAASLGRLASRHHLSVTEHLCAALADSRSYVRANSLGALRLTGKRCADERARQLLMLDRSEVVRAAAAVLVQSVPAQRPELDRSALKRCAQDDVSGSVAAACSNPPEPIAEAKDPVTVYVVPTGDSSPVPGAPFALVRADGIMRLGVADRSGAVYEHDAPRGFVSLAVPAPLVR